MLKQTTEFIKITLLGFWTMFKPLSLVAAFVFTIYAIYFGVNNYPTVTYTIIGLMGVVVLIMFMYLIGSEVKSDKKYFEERK